MTGPPLPIPETIQPPTCPYCGASAVLRQNPWGYVWCCDPCDARVGCHQETMTPKGTLANAATRAARIAAHEAFDQLWRMKLDRHPHMRRSHARQRAYEWLARTLNIDVDLCHIAMMNAAECMRVVEVCAAKLVALQHADRTPDHRPLLTE